MDRQLEFDRWLRHRVPRLTDAMRVGLKAVELAGGRPLCEMCFQHDGRNGYEVSAPVLKRLLRLRLIEVMGLGPAVYRLTKLGRVARSLGVRS